ncbi:hypothetical protein BS78_02G308800 [Paspalum vaginatum]|nr:hypothetical protein BS78_02G308800 [Paspalum vaginatum]KAJ1291333.1 hypothetical protein BS78_02G308800 [Paspalum vaginatum]KAJ1291334.1 hypothetical protein BS78_02G308800 [Paspalum vaginatum]
MATEKTKKPAYRLFPAVQLVSEYAFLMAITYPVGYAVSYALAYALNHYHVSCSQSSLVLRCANLTDAQDAQLSDLWNAILWCAAVQAAVAVLALRRRLPCHRRGIRRAFAYVALVATVANHGMYASTVFIFLLAAYPGPGDLPVWICFITVIVFCAALDLLSFLALVFLGGDEED